MSQRSQGMTIPPELEAEMTPAVRAFVELLLGRVAQLEAEVADLKQRLSKYEKYQRTDSAVREGDPSDANGPTGPTGPSAMAGAAAESSPQAQHPKNKQKKRGGQPGHVKHTRPLIPTADCDEVQVLRPEACRRCGGL
jgi:transposase